MSVNKIHLNFKHFIVFLLLTSLLCTAVASCGSASDTSSKLTSTDTTTADTVEETTDRLYADVPTQDFGGYTFNALYWFNSGWPWRNSKDIYAEEASGDTIADAVYTRNLAISEKYNVKFELTEKSYDQLGSVLTKCVKAGDDVYTIVCQVQGSALTMITSGDLYDISQIPYVNLENPWWDQNSVSGYSIAHRVYLVASDITINDKDGTAAIAFNKQAATDNQLPDLYAMVRDGSWTIDNMYDTYKNVARDVNGDSKMNEEDFYGFIGGRDVPATFFQGGGAMIISKDADDIPFISFKSDQNFSLAQRLFELVKQTDIFYDHHIMGTDDAAYQKLFEENHGLYFWMRLDAVSDMRSSETEFGILPIPKYTEDQDSYHCVVSVHTSSLMSVPVVTQNFERTGILLEALAAESKYTLMHAYYDVALKTKYSRDDESSEMLDIIFANRVFDLGELINPGGVRDLILYMSDKKSYDIASAYAKIEKTAAKQLDKTVTKIEDLAE
jgi:hypothetical protein